jgi:predicted transcriptional regulator
MTSGSPPVALRGEQSKNARLTEADIPEIRKMYRAGWKYKEIAADLGVVEETIRHVLIGKTWTHIPDPDGPIVMQRRGPQSDECANTKLDWASVRAIRAGHAAGKSYSELASEFGVAKPTIAGIVKGRQWKEKAD